LNRDASRSKLRGPIFQYVAAIRDYGILLLNACIAALALRRSATGLRIALKLADAYADQSETEIANLATMLEPQWLVQVQLFEADRQLRHLLVVTLAKNRSRLLQRLLNNISVQ
jgi:hypothetical protein